MPRTPYRGVKIAVQSAIFRAHIRSRHDRSLSRARAQICTVRADLPRRRPPFRRTRYTRFRLRVPTSGRPLRPLHGLELRVFNPLIPSLRSEYAPEHQGRTLVAASLAPARGCSVFFATRAALVPLANRSCSMRLATPIPDAKELLKLLLDAWFSTRLATSSARQRVSLRSTRSVRESPASAHLRERTRASPRTFLRSDFLAPRHLRSRR